MNDLVQLTEAEIAAVSGGTQSISIAADQSNSSSISQDASASNSGAVTATASGSYAVAAAAGAVATNVASVSQRNVIVARNSIRY